MNSRMKTISLLLALFGISSAIGSVATAQEGAEPAVTRAKIWWAGFPGENFPETLFFLSGGEPARLSLYSGTALGPVEYRGGPRMDFYADERQLMLPLKDRNPPVASVEISSGSWFLLFKRTAEDGMRVLAVPYADDDPGNRELKVYNLANDTLMGLVNGERTKIPNRGARTYVAQPDSVRAIPVVVFQLAQRNGDKEHWERAYVQRIVLRDGVRMLMFLYRDQTGTVKAAMFKSPAVDEQAAE